MNMAMTKSSTLAIANFFIRKSLKEKKPITQIKLQKLVFFAHGFYLVLNERPLVDEKIEAWQYGPVVPSIYHKFKNWGNSPIKKVHIEKSESLIINEKDIDFLDLVWHKFSQYTASQLVELSHQKGGPWQKAIDKSKALVGFIVPNIMINNLDIYVYFKSKYIQESIEKAYTMG